MIDLTNYCFQLNKAKKKKYLFFWWPLKKKTESVSRIFFRCFLNPTERYFLLEIS